MKKLFLPLILICAAISCKKEIVVNDNQVNSISTQSNDNATVTGTTLFGAKIYTGTTEEKLLVVNKLGAKASRTSIGISSFNGKAGMIDKGFAAGLKMIVNLDWQNPGGGVKKFPTNMVTYRAALKKVLDKYASKIEVAVCENEPTTDGFYEDNIQAYLTELKTFVEVCNSYGVKCTDGCVHIDNVLQIINDVKRPGKNVADVKTMINAYKNIPMTFVNIHTNGSGSSYPAGRIKLIANYLRNLTGHPVMSNEWHVDNATPELIKNMVGQWKEAQIVYSVIWSGGGKSSADAVNAGTNLTNIGGAYRDAIK